MPDVSVIITFHETEGIAHLLRTVHSLIQRTPAELLKEIILIADNTHNGKVDPHTPPPTAKIQSDDLVVVVEIGSVQVSDDQLLRLDR